MSGNLLLTRENANKASSVGEILLKDSSPAGSSVIVLHGPESAVAESAFVIAVVSGVESFSIQWI